MKKVWQKMTLFAGRERGEKGKQAPDKRQALVND